MRYQSSIATAQEQAQFVCRFCGHSAACTVVGMGEGIASSLNANGTSRTRAAEDARADLKRTVRAARCPRCARRSHVLQWWAPWLGNFVLVVGLIAGLMWAPHLLKLNMRPEGAPFWIGLVGSLCSVALVLPFFALSVWPRWSSVDARVRF